MTASSRRAPRKVPGLLTQDLGAEVVVIDPATNEAHALAGVTAQLWRSLDAGELPKASDGELSAALSELSTAGLIQSQGLSRRALLQRTGTVAVAGTVITI